MIVSLLICCRGRVVCRSLLWDGSCNNASEPGGGGLRPWLSCSFRIFEIGRERYFLFLFCVRLLLGMGSLEGLVDRTLFSGWLAILLMFRNRSRASLSATRDSIEQNFGLLLFEFCLRLTRRRYRLFPRFGLLAK